MSAVAIDLDALADTRPLWEAWLQESARRFATIADLDPATLPSDRVEAAAQLDDWAAAGVGDWRAALERWAEDRAPVYLRRDARVAVALRGLGESGSGGGVFSDAPESLVRVALRQLGASQRVELVEAGPCALERLLSALGEQARVFRTRDELLRGAV